MIKKITPVSVITSRWVHGDSNRTWSNYTGCAINIVTLSVQYNIPIHLSDVDQMREQGGHVVPHQPEQPPPHRPPCLHSAPHGLPRHLYHLSKVIIFHEITISMIIGSSNSEYD